MTLGCTGNREFSDPPMSRSWIRAWGAVAMMVGVATFLIVVLILHMLQPDYEPRHQLMSELALGQHGWAMILAFFGLATAVLGLQAAVAESGGSRGYRVLLGAAALFFLAAGVFPLGATALIHISAIGAAFVLSVLAMYLFPTSARRASVAGPRAVSWPVAAGVAVSVASGHSVIPLGIGQRLAAVCLLAWLGIVGWRLYRL
jgi:hypothetical membrane protein